MNGKLMGGENRFRCYAGNGLRSVKPMRPLKVAAGVTANVTRVAAIFS